MSFKTKTAAVGTPLTVSAFLGERRSHVIAHLDNGLQVVVSIADLADPVPQDLPVNHEYLRMAPSPTEVGAKSIVPVAASPAPAPQVAVTPAPQVAAAPAAQDPAPPAKTVSPEAPPAAAPAPVPPPAPPAPPTAHPLPEKLPKGKARSKVYAYIKGVEKAPAGPQDARTVGDALELARTHGDAVVISDGQPWQPASEFFKRYLA